MLRHVALTAVLLLCHRALPAAAHAGPGCAIVNATGPYDSIGSYQPNGLIGPSALFSFDGYYFRIRQTGLSGNLMYTVYAADTTTPAGGDDGAAWLAAMCTSTSVAPSFDRTLPDNDDLVFVPGTGTCYRQLQYFYFAIFVLSDAVRSA